MTHINWRRGFPVLLAAAILAMGILLPQWAFRRMRQSYLQGERVTSAAAIHPYGEAYEEKKSALLAAVRLIYSMDRDGDAVELPRKEASTQSQQDYAAALAQLTEFLAILQDQLTMVDCGGQLDDLSQGNQLLYHNKGEEEYIGYLELIDEVMGAENQLGFALDSGTPLALSLALPLSSAEEPDREEVWSGVLEAYQQFTGIPFLDRSDSQAHQMYDSTSQSTDGGTGWEKVYLTDCEYQAVSGDAVFSLSGTLTVNGEWLVLNVYLAENGVTG